MFWCLSKIIFSSWLMFFSGVTLQSAISFGSATSTLKLVGASSALKLNAFTPLIVNNGTIYADTFSATSIQGTTTGDTITFSGGFLQTSGNSKFFTTSSYDPTTGDTFKLTGNGILESFNDSVIQSVNISGTGNVINGSPVFGSALVLADSATSVTLNLQHNLSQNITMNGGTVILGDNLTLETNIFFTGTGTCNVNNKGLTISAMQSTPWSGSTTFLNASDIDIDGYVSLTGTWTFSGAGVSSRINGKGNNLDLSSGGTISIGANHTLYIANLNIIGLATARLSMTSTSSLRIYETNLTSNGAFVLSAGTITVQGGQCYYYARGTDTFSVAAGGTLVVDGVAFLYDNLDASGAANPIVNTGGTITLSNNGVIRSALSGGALGGNLSITATSATLTTSQILSPFSTITIVNATPASPKAVTLDGQGHFIQFNYLTNSYFTLQQNVTLTLTNVMLKDFDISLMTFGGAGGTLAKVQFGDNVIVEFGKNQTISTTPLTVVGNATLDLQGATLTLSAAGAINNTTAAKTCTIRGGTVNMTNATAIQATNDTAKILFQNVSVTSTNVGFTFSQGSMDIRDKVSFFGLDQTAVAGTSIFTFASKGLLTVTTNSSLVLDRGMTFSYNPNITSDGGVVAVQKRHFRMADPSATINLNTCTVASGLMGMAFDYGRILIDGRTILNVSPAANAEVEFGTALDVNITANAVLEVNGGLKYTATTYP